MTGVLIPRRLARDIASYLEDVDVQVLVDSYSDLQGRITPAGIRKEVARLRSWIQQLRAAMEAM